MARPANTELHDQIRSLADGQRTAKEIAELIGARERSVREILTRLDLPRRKPGSGAPRQRTPESLARIEAIKALADGRRSSHEIAQAVGASAKYVQSILLEFDLPRLPQSAPHGERNPAYIGGRRIDLDGYVFVTAPPGHPHVHIPKGKRYGRMYEHRLVVEQKLERFLLPEEVVDHIDGLTVHNHPDNLRVFASNSDHLRATISDQIPHWSDEGFGKMCLSNPMRAASPLVDSYRQERERGDVRLRQILRAWLSLGEDSPYLLGTHHWLERAGIRDLSPTNLELHLQQISQRYTSTRAA